MVSLPSPLVAPARWTGCHVFKFACMRPIHFPRPLLRRLVQRGDDVCRSLISRASRSAQRPVTDASSWIGSLGTAPTRSPCPTAAPVGASAISLVRKTVVAANLLRVTEQTTLCLENGHDAGSGLSERHELRTRTDNQQVPIDRGSSQRDRIERVRGEEFECASRPHCVDVAILADHVQAP